MYRYCPGCHRRVHSRLSSCGGCGTSFAELMLWEEAMGGGLIDGNIGYDPIDGQFAFDIPGTDLAIESDGQIDLDLGGFDIPL